MDVVIAGYGNAGELHATLLANRPDTRIVGVADRTAARRAAASARFPAATVASGLDELAVRADVVVVCTPPAYHEADTEIALTRHRAHVLCEKPAVLDPNVGHRLGKIAAEAGLVLHPVHNYLHSPAIAELLAIATRSIGHLTQVAITISRTGPAHGHAAWRPTWRTEPTAGGGILYDHGPHACYLACHLTGQPATSVRCTVTTGTDGADHAAQLRLRLGNGSAATITLNWYATTRTNCYELSGEHGTVRLRNGWLTMTTPRTSFSVETEDHSAGGLTHREWTEGVQRVFLDRVTRTSLDNEPWNRAVHVGEILAAAKASAAADQQPVQIGQPRSA